MQNPFVRVFPASRKKAKAATPNADALMKKAFGFYLQRNYVEATKLFKQCFVLNPDDVSVNFYLGAAALVCQ